MHSIVPVNLHSSINVSQCSNVCPILTDLVKLGQPIFRNISAIANNTIDPGCGIY